MTKLVKCQHCRTPFERPQGRPGRPARFCKRSCRQRAFERRRRRSKTGLRRQPTRGYESNDRVMTPLPLAQALAAALQPSGVILEPTAGTGNFVRALEPYGDVQWCEIDRGRDFFDWTEPVDEIVTNPPWSLFAKVLAHALRLARGRVALVATVNHFWTRHRRELVRAAGFGIERIIECDAPKEWGAPTGFQLAMVVLTRGYEGPCTVESLTPDEHAPARRPECPSRPIAAPLRPSGTQTRTHHPPATLGAS